jgi:glycosyltransferase involved in cell wall biosynthesis
MLSAALITLNEEHNLERTLASVRSLAGEIVVVDCGSTDATLEIARQFGAKVFREEWKGYGTQKNSAIAKCTGEWVLSLDADEAVEPELAAEIKALLEGKAGASPPLANGYFIPRKNFFLGRWMKQGGFWPDPKIRLFRRGTGQFEERKVHETMRVNGPVGMLRGALSHHTYPTLEGYLAQMNRYSSLGAQMGVAGGQRGFSLLNIVLRPKLTFLYNYVLRLGFLDGKEGLLLHLYHACYVSWKYAKVWELSRKTARSRP